MMARVLVACEESQAVTLALRKQGVEAFSCDIEPCSGGHPEWHLQADVRRVFKYPWDMVLAFPPCTDLAVSGALHFAQKQADGRQQVAIDFFMLFVNANCNRIAIENPVGIMSTRYRKPDQIIQPYDFGEDASKKTCLWLKRLPPLKGTKHIPGRMIECNGKMVERWANQTDSGQNRLGPSSTRAADRAKTYQGIADAMADQWGGLL